LNEIDARGHTLDIAKGFQIEQPRIFVPWGITKAGFESLFRGSDLERGTNGVPYLGRCKALCGLDLRLSFRFDPLSGALCRIRPTLRTTWFRVRHSRDKIRSIPLEVQFDEIQAHLEATFGPSSTASPGEGFTNYTWLFPGVRIEHSTHEHFGPNEDVFIEKVDDDEEPTVAPRNCLRETNPIPRRTMSRAETQNLKKVLGFMERDGRVEAVDASGLSPVCRRTETLYRFVGTKAIHRFIELESGRGGKWELVLPEHVRGAVQ
jgi:hypothetical protein